MKGWHLCAAMALFLTLCFSRAAQAQTSTPFFLPPSFLGTNQPVTADFNRDGKLDLVNADGTVLLGNGDGTFTAGTPLQVGGPSARNLIATADFNGDGKPDLVFASPTSNTFYVLLGKGDGTFQAPMITTVASPLSALIVGDVNGDGKPDVLGVSSVSGLLLTYLGKGDGTFSAGVMSGAASSGTLADFNGDGKLDLAVATGIQLGNGDGPFKALIPFPTGSLGATVTGDFNGDGKLDLAGGASGTASNPDQLQILFGNGDGTFQLAPVQSLPSGTLAGSLVAAANLNNGGTPDLVAEVFPYVQVFKNNGDGTFTAGFIYNLYLAPAVPYLIVGDFNGDGNLDLVTDNTVLLGNGDGTLRGNQAIPNFGSALVTGDFNNDGHPDIASSLQFSPASTATVNIFLNDGKGNLSLAHTYTFLAGGMFNGASLVAAVDVNGDGKVDLILTDSERGSWSVIIMLGNGDGSFQAPTTFPGSGPGLITGFAVADLNGDHKPDLLVVAGSYIGSPGFLWVMLNNGDGTFVSPVQYYVGSGNASVAVGDFNNDGKIDAAVANRATQLPATTGIAILLGNGDGTFQPPTFNTPLGNTEVGQIFACDVNGDDNVDLLAPTTNQTQVLLGNGDGTFTTSTTIANTLGVLNATDFNGDGKIDLLAADVSGLLSLLFGNGDGTFASPILLPALGGPVVADFNGDNRPDIAGSVPGSTVFAFREAGLVWLFNTSGPPAPDFVITSTPLKPATLSPGNSATSTITLTAVGGFSAGVTLSCTGLPSGATCIFAPTSLPSASGTSTLTIVATSSTAVGTYSVTIVGTSSGPTHQHVIPLTIAQFVGATTVTLAPQTLPFAQQATGNPSSPQIVTLTNTGAASLTISSIAITGANASDFSQTNTCGSSLGVGMNCQISVIFNPAGMGGRTATLAVNDNANGTPQTVTLTGTGPDFSISAGATSTATVSPGQTATYTVSVAPGGGFAQTVALTCTGAPALSTCTVSPSSVALSGAAQTPTVSITTTAASALFRPTEGDRTPRIRHRIIPLVLVLAAMSMLMMALAHQGSRHRWTPVALGVLLCAGLLLSSCGGGSPGGTGTQAGTYTVTVTGTFTSGSITLTHTTNLTLIVH